MLKTYRTHIKRKNRRKKAGAARKAKARNTGTTKTPKELFGDK